MTDGDQPVMRMGRWEGEEYMITINGTWLPTALAELQHLVGSAS